MSKINFLKAAIRDYRVGALTSSSTIAAQKIANALPSDARYVVEYGAGDGAVTRLLLNKLPEDARLVAIELNEQLIRSLHKIDDPRLTVVHGSAVNASLRLHDYGLPRIDAIVSGIPFSFFGPAVRRKIVQETFRGLKPGGVMIAYQASPILVSFMKLYTKRVRVRFEPRNFPPYFIIVGEKAGQD